MAPTIYDLWAKTNDRDHADGQPWRRHPLPLHLVDVALVAEAWLAEDAGLFERFCHLWPSAEPEDIRRALVLTAAAHDLGKVYPEFQAKSSDGWALGYGLSRDGRAPKGVGFDHGRGTAELFKTLFTGGGRRGGTPDGYDPAWRSLAPLVAVAAGHHGTLYHDIQPCSRVRSAPWRQMVVDLLDEVAHHLGPVPDLPADPPPPFLLLTAGLVSVADWFGSNADSFPLAPDVTTREFAEAYVEDHRQRGTAAQALANAGLLNGFDVPTAFGDLFRSGTTAWTPRPGFQTAACALDFGAEPGAEIVVVEAPMGLGKTEIALWLAAGAIRHGTADGLYDALPTQATANAAFGRARDVAGRMGSRDDLALALAHGGKRFVAEHKDLRRDTAARALAGRAVTADPDDPAPPSEVVALSWLQPSKRALLSPIGVGTIDQALLGAMGVRHGFVRLFALARKVVVIDEVHAYDAYTGTLLRHLLRWLSALGTKVILLSATLPAGLRASLLDAYGAGDADRAPDAYPRLVHARPDDTAEVVTDPHATGDRRDENVTVQIQLVEPAASGDPDARTAAGVAYVRRQSARGGCVAWIRNTVREAQDAYRLLCDAGEPAVLLHARFARADRNAIEETLLRRLGPPGADRPDRLVVVATQVIEQSVDLDFDAMLSDLAPVDLLLQRAGRLWRHRRPERHEHTEPILGVLMPTAADRSALAFGPSAYVYDADTLARSAVIVRDEPAWTLPQACRDLVARLYDDEWSAADLNADPDRLDTVRAALAKQTARMETAARQAFLSEPDRPPEVRQPRNDRSDAGAYVTLTTRYGAHTAAAALFRDTPAGPVPVGATEPLATPADGDWLARLVVEEAVELASVSFPWYGDAPAEVTPPGGLANLHAWWRRAHPYDDRQFVLVSEGSFEHGAMAGRYSDTVGLRLGRAADAPADAPPFESL